MNACNGSPLGDRATRRRSRPAGAAPLPDGAEAGQTIAKGDRTMRQLLARPWMTEREYRANIEGLNIFFGAVLGFVLAGAEALDAGRFAVVLLLVGMTVVTILYITASHRRLSYALLAAVVIATMPHIASELLDGAALPAKVQPTLAVWAALITAIEFAPRERADVTP